MLSAVLVSCGFLFILTETTNARRQDEVGISYKRFHTFKILLFVQRYVQFYYLYKDMCISLKKSELYNLKVIDLLVLRFSIIARN